MNYSIYYFSKTGNTAQLAESLAAALPAEGKTYFGSEQKSTESPLVLVGFWTDKGNCDAQCRECLQSLHGKTIALFGTAGFGGDASYFEKILTAASAWIPEDNTVLPGFMCQGKMPPAIRKRYEGLLAQNPQDMQAQSLLENFDRAASHPDSDDLKAVQEWGRQIYSHAMQE